jgi:hypothetical protein
MYECTAVKSLARWQLVWLAAAALWAGVVAWQTAPRVADAARDARTRLIQQTQLWETEPAYAGKPEAWTRFAAWLLSDEQLLDRVRRKYGERAEEIETEYRRDEFVALGALVLAAFAIWGVPVGAAYAGMSWHLRRRERRQGIRPPSA